MFLFFFFSLTWVFGSARTSTNLTGPEINDYVSLQWLSYKQPQGLEPETTKKVNYLILNFYYYITQMIICCTTQGESRQGKYFVDIQLCVVMMISSSRRYSRSQAPFVCRKVVFFWKVNSGESEFRESEFRESIFRCLVV